MTSIELLPDELLLDIFELLGVKDRGRCAQTSKRFRKVSQDETLWQKLNLDEKEVPSQFLELAISRGLKYLSFRCAKLSGHQNLPIDTKSVKYLNVSSYNSWGYKANEEELTALVSCFSSLEKLSLGFLSMKNPAIINCILQNRETLKVLDLTECRDLTLELIKDIVRNCDQLTEVSFWGNNLCQSAIAFICDNLTPTIEKINFSSSRLCSENLSDLVVRCQKLTELELDHTMITDEAVTTIIEYLPQSLVSLVLPDQISFSKVVELCKKMPKLKCISYIPPVPEDADYDLDLDNSRLIELENRFPHLKIGKNWGSIAMPGEGSEIWEIKCQKANQFPVRQDFAEHVIAMDKWMDDMAQCDEIDHLLGNTPEAPQNLH